MHTTKEVWNLATTTEGWGEARPLPSHPAETSLSDSLLRIPVGNPPPGRWGQDRSQSPLETSFPSVFTPPDLGPWGRSGRRRRQSRAAPRVPRPHAVVEVAAAAAHPKPERRATSPPGAGGAACSRPAAAEGRRGGRGWPATLRSRHPRPPPRLTLEAEARRPPPRATPSAHWLPLPLGAGSEESAGQSAPR